MRPGARSVKCRRGARRERAADRAYAGADGAATAGSHGTPGHADRARAGGARATGVHHHRPRPRPRRRRGSLDRGDGGAQPRGARRRAWAAGMRYLDAARSYGYAERFLASWLRARAIDPAHGHRRLEVGLPVRRRVADGRPGPRGQGPRPRDAPHPAPRVARLLGPWLRLYQVHSATLESGILDGRRGPRRARPAPGGGGSRRRDVGERAAPGRRRPRRTRDPRRRRQPVLLRPGDVESARAVRRTGACRGARRRLGRDRQGGARERPPAGARPGSSQCGRPHGVGPMPSRSPPCSRTRGPTSPCPARPRRHRSSSNVAAVERRA